MEIYAITNAQGEVYSTYEIDQKLKNSGIPETVIKQGEAAIKNYAAEHNIKLPESEEQAKTESKTVGLGGKHDPTAELVALGIPQETILQGKEAVEKYATEHNIKLPEPPRGAKMNFVS